MAMILRPLLFSLPFLSVLAASAQVPTGASPSAPLFGVNLLMDPGAEATDEAGQAAWGGSAHFTSKGCGMTAEPYGMTAGVFPKGWGEQNGHGRNLFRFSCTERKEVRTLPQRFDLTALADTLDHGHVVGRITGQMASVGNPGLRGNVVVEYRNMDDKTIQVLKTNNLPCAVKGDAWKLTRCAQSGMVPAGTRYAVVYLSMILDEDAKPGGSFVMDDVAFELIQR
jgi:hypothetical protein